MPEIGKKISFVPAAFMGIGSVKVLADMPRKVKGVIDYINYEHRWFRARFEVWGQTMHECFKF
jgi:hypothetical protein